MSKRSIFYYTNLFKKDASSIPDTRFASLFGQRVSIDNEKGKQYSVANALATAYSQPLQPFAIAYSGYLEAFSRAYLALCNSDVSNCGGFAKLEHGWIAQVCMESGAILNANNCKGDYKGSDKVLFYNDSLNKELQAVTIDENGNVSRLVISRDNTKKAGTMTPVAFITAMMMAIGNMDPTTMSMSPEMEVLRNSLDEAMRHPDDSDMVVIACDNFCTLAKDYPDELANVLGFSKASDIPDTFSMLDLSEDWDSKINHAKVLGSVEGFSNHNRGFSFEQAESYKNTNKTVTVGSLFGKYDSDPERVRTPEERKLIDAASYVDDMEASEELCYMAEMIQKSSNMKHRMRNFILRGPAGTGKTTMVKQLSRLLNLPAVTFEMSPDTDKLDLTMSAIPAGADEDNSEESADEWMKTMPKSVDWAMDPVSSYQMITGKLKNDANADDCERAVLSMYAEKKARENGKSGGFKYVLSNIMKAMKNGWIVEVQEPTICTRPGVLASLNALSDDCQQVSLMNGESVHRDKDAVMVYTTNTDYEGCYPLNQSQLSRFAIMTINLPGDEEIIQRLSAESGLNDHDKLKRMVDVYNACKELAEQKGVTDGSIDFRALSDWAVAAVITGNYYKSGLRMMIEKTTADPELQEEFITCLDSQFMKNE